MSEQPSIDGTRLDPAVYLEHVDSEAAALLAAADDLEAAVPGCPGWTVRDLLSHVVGVYRHKIVVLDTDAQPPARDDAWGAIPDGADPRDVLREVHAALRERLRAREASAPTYAWWPPEQTVGFWQRRMAQETAVHRWDAESARDGVDGASPVDADLAADGIDELLGWLTWPWDDDPQSAASGQSVVVSTADHTWTVTLHPTRVEVAGGGSDDAVALLAGEPSGLLLHLWGRPGEHGVAVAGDETALALLRERLATATT
ncbi:MAG: maleylpyruvate isomerase family mycothiol-dependent enzyme [Frankiales bacterium]|nr:maleylpyruvate isomerase family mycothiol-dependent enzyme [Frankiales bacterium]